MNIRIGLGYDRHRLEVGRPLILGGVTIPHDKGLLGHSDADVLTHAVIDALLGAAALGNIGLLYPDTDPAFKGADSMKLLADTVARVKAAGYRLVNIDTNIIAERPKLNPHLHAIRESLARTLTIAADAVSVKPKTNERLGPEGHEEALSAQAIALLINENG